MKKIFLSAVIALALCSYGYAQDEEEYEEEEAAPAKVAKAPAYEEEEEEDEAPAPAPKKAEKKKEKKASNGDQGFFGVGLDLTGALARQTAVNLTFRLNDNMLLSAIFGFQHHGETTHTPKQGDEVKDGDDANMLTIGAAFDFMLVKKFIPFSIGGEFAYNSLSEDDSRIDFGVLAGLHGEIVPNLILTGKAGLEFLYNFGDEAGGNSEYSRLDFGVSYKVYLTWFAF